MILTKKSPEVAIIRGLFYRCRGMVLVPTMEKMVGQFVAEDFWANHQRCQDELDRQGELSFWGPRRLKTKDDHLTPLEKMFPVVAT